MASLDGGATCEFFQPHHFNPTIGVCPSGSPAVGSDPIELPALKRVKVFCGDYNMARDDLKELDGYLKMHDLERAMTFATSMVGKTMGVGEHVVARAICRYHQLRSLRTGMAVKN